MLTFENAVQKVELVFGNELSAKRLVTAGSGWVSMQQGTESAYPIHQRLVPGDGRSCCQKVLIRTDSDRHLNFHIRSDLREA